MKVLPILTVLCITLALCHGACLVAPPQLTIKDGKIVDPDGCVDPFDGSKHPFQSEWNTENCHICYCDSKGEVQCCSRYGSIAVAEGCKAVVDPETCTYKFYKADDPSTPCPGF
ncbi:small serum protein 5-like [Eublepharis macularius]|uniref:Small serum protein 5-like n=1 Tax=Eublepharis macularius TaxID=481883 RepID=A0AA97KCP4_EUBMA|nr:small serum protein 5-like [Eublepharis macularius]